jgi:proteic killer suppression protein
MIVSFADRDTEALFNQEPVKRIASGIRRVALRKLVMIDAAETLDDLRSPPGNRLEPLRGDRGGQHSIRVNDQWRIVFTWRAGGAYNVAIVDYH